MAASNASTAPRCHALLTESLTKLTWWLSTILRIRRRGRSRNSSILFLLTLAALAARLHRIDVDSRVVWDETHFGRFATRYINGEFYLDVHPPLGKLLLTLVYRALGYSGGFEFASGDTYPSSVPFVAARCVQACLGALLAPVSVLILQTLHLPAAWAWIAGVSVALDNALIGISRIVVLDSMLLLANALSVYAFLCFKQAQKQRLQRALVLGAALGLLCSIKLVGLLTLAVFDVFLIGDMIVYTGTAKGCLQELACLLSINGTPLLVYILGFLAQFGTFRNYTPEADHMGSEYVTRLNNSALSLQYPTIRSGSFVVLRSAEYPFEYLSAYAASNSSEYVLATRRRLAVEDYWRVQPPSSSGFSNKKSIGYGNDISLFVPKSSVSVSVLRHGLVGLENKSRNEKASADTAIYSRELAETGASEWRIIPGRKHGNTHGFIPVVSKFRLQSIKHGCELAIDYRRLLYDEHLIDNPVSVPRQHLFKCAERGRGTLWNIEHHLSAVAETPINLSQYVRVSHFRDFSSYNRLMHELNGMLVSDPDQISAVESHPLGWPFLADPMPMVQWQPEDASAKKYMLIGNPALWWLSALVCVWIHPLAFLLNLAVYRRSHGKVAKLEIFSPSNFLWFLWAAHYFPFFVLSRATYLHHYLPAFFFALLLSVVYTWKLYAFSCCKNLSESVSFRRRIGNAIPVYMMVLVILVLVGYWFAYPLTYGADKPCKYTRYAFLKSWKTCGTPNILS